MNHPYLKTAFAALAAAYIFVLRPAGALGEEPDWKLMSREDGCVSIELLAKYNKLPRVPSTPEEYAAMMLGRGHKVTVGFPPGLPPELKDKVFVVTIDNDKAPVFVRSEVCGNLVHKANK